MVGRILVAFHLAVAPGVAKSPPPYRISRCRLHAGRAAPDISPGAGAPDL